MENESKTGNATFMEAETAINVASGEEDPREDESGPYPYIQNRELSWLSFNERVLDQGANPNVPLLERLKFLSIFWSNLQEFFMIRVGSLTDLSLVKKRVVDNKTNMTPSEQLDAVYARCHELYPAQEEAFLELRQKLADNKIYHLALDQLKEDQLAFLKDYLSDVVMPVLSPQIVNALHPFPHLENGWLYLIVRLDVAEFAKNKEGKKKKNPRASGVTIGIIPLPRQSERIIKLPGPGCSFILLEHALELIVPEVFSMYAVKHSNLICVTRNADLDPSEGVDENDDDYREYMKRILKKRFRLAPVRLESQRPLSNTVASFLLKRLNLKEHQAFVTSVPLDMSYSYEIAKQLSEKQAAELSYPPFSPSWLSTLDQRPLMEQVSEKEILLSYPYESMDPFIQLLKEAANDPSVLSIKITLYRLARQSHLAEALIAAAENGKEVTALFELRARFDESNNIEWSGRFEQAGAKVLYGFRDHKVHSKICCIIRQGDKGLQYITQLGTGNYNEKTAKLYTDFSFITSDEGFGRDALKYFRNMGLENIADNYDLLWVAPLQMKSSIIAHIDAEIEKRNRGEACGLFFKTNSITDKEIILKLSEASQAGVPTTLFVRGICCLVPGIVGYTENIRVVSLVGRLLEHSRIYGFGPLDSMKIYLSSADLMTRNMDRRIEIAWPILNDALRSQVISYVSTMLNDTVKLRELLPDHRYAEPKHFTRESIDAKNEDTDEDELIIKANNATTHFDAQEALIKESADQHLAAVQEEAEQRANS